MPETLRTLTYLGFYLGLTSPVLGEELIWSTLPLVGAAELKDGKPANGVVYEAQHLLEQNLPELQHRYVISTPSRLLHEMKSGVPRCSTLLLRNPELDSVAYFVPYLPILPIQLVVRSDMLGKLPIEEGRVSFEQLLQHSEWRGALVEKRGYPSELQPLLDLGLAKGSITTINSPSSGSNLLSMISYGRLDYSLEYPVVVQHFSETTALRKPLTTVLIAENIQMSSAGLYCTRTAWGKGAATQLDQAIRNIISNPEQLLPMYRKTVELKIFDYYESQLRAYLASRARPPTEF